MPKKNKDFAGFKLSELKQQTSERLADYYAKVRETAKKCDYGTQEDDHVIRTMLNHKIRSKATWDNWALDRILTETALDEQTIEQTGAISKEIDEHLSHERVKKLTEKQSENPTNQNTSERNGNSKAHTICPAIGVSCDKCGN